MRRIIFSTIAVASFILKSCGEKDKSSSGINTGNSRRNQVQVDTAEITGRSNVPVDTQQTISTSGEIIKYNKNNNQSFDTTAN